MRDYRKDKEYIELKEKYDKASFLCQNLDFALNEYVIDALKKQYGNQLDCDNCKYNAVYDCDDSGWHNKCGHYAAPCTCCHSYCRYFAPDNEITKWIKENIKYISLEQRRALDVFYLDPMTDLTLTEEKIDLIKTLLQAKYIK